MDKPEQMECSECCGTGFTTGIYADRPPGVLISGEAFKCKACKGFGVIVRMSAPQTPPSLVENEEDTEEARVGELLFDVLQENSSDKGAATAALFVAFGMLADKHSIPFRVLRDMAAVIFGDAARLEEESEADAKRRAAAS